MYIVSEVDKSKFYIACAFVSDFYVLSWRGSSGLVRCLRTLCFSLFFLFFSFSLFRGSKLNSFNPFHLQLHETTEAILRGPSHENSHSRCGVTPWKREICLRLNYCWQIRISGSEGVRARTFRATEN